MSPLVLDLDFTLLHLAHVEDAIEVPGRTRSAWISPQTVEALRDLGRDHAIVLATARSWDGARWVVDGLANRGVMLSDVVFEDGACYKSSDEVRQVQPRDWNALRRDIEAQRDNWPVYEWQRDFHACLVARAETSDDARVLESHFARIAHVLNAKLRTFRDGRKVYITGEDADKWRALRLLLGEDATRAAGIGDGLNDACWLRHIALPCTLTGATPDVIQLVRERGGYVSPLSGHDGIADALRWLRAHGLG